MDILDAVFVYQMQQKSELKWHGRTHAHGDHAFEIHYFLSGNGEFVNGTNTYAIKAGLLFVSAPHMVHAIKAKAQDMVTYYAILMTLDAGQVDLERMLTEHSQSSPFPIGTNYRFFFEEIKEKGLSSSAARRQSACHQLCSLLYQLGEQAPVVGSGMENRHLEHALRMMQHAVMGRLVLDDLAGELHLSKSYFIRLFRQRMHQTPMKYYMKLKIEAASALLSCTDLPVKVIADKLGFSSEFHFSRQFKTHTGLAPTLYRRAYEQTLQEEPCRR